MADTRISQLPDTAVQDDALVVPVVETAGATKTTKRQSVGTMLSGRAKTDLSNLDEDLTPSEQSTIRDRIGAHAGGTGAVDFDSLASDLRDAVEKSVAVGGISLTDRNVEFVSDDATHFAITLPREMPDPAVGDAGKHSRVNDTEDGYELVDAPREVPAGGVSGQVVKRTATGYEWGADAGLSEAEVKAEIRPEAQVDLAALSSVQQAAARMRIGASSGAGHDGVETLEVRATPPPAADYSRGDVIDVGGALYELVADDADASVVSGAAAATSGVYVGGPLFEWSPTASGHALIRALLPKSALGAPPPAGLAFLYRDSTGYTLREASYPGTAVGLRRDSSRDTRTHYGYATPATGERIPTAAGARYRVDFFEPETSTAAQFSRRRTVHDADRWELVDRGLTATIDARIESGVGVANGALPTTLPRPAGSAASPPSVRAVTAALDASLTDGAAAWGPARNYDAAASLRAVADGDYHRAGDRELVIDPHSGDRKLLLAAHAIRIGGAACSASITAHGHGVAHKRSAPVAVGQGTDVERFEGRTGGVLRVHSVALPREGDVVSFNRVNRGTVNVTERYRVIKAGNGWFEIYEGTVLTEAADDDGRWFTVAVGGFTGDVADVTAASRVPAVQSGAAGWKLTVDDATAFEVGDVVSITGMDGLDANTLYPVRDRSSTSITIVDPKTGVAIDTAHAVRLSVHTDTDLPAALADPLPIAFPDVIRTARGGMAASSGVRRPQEVIAWIRAADETAAKAGVGAATFSNDGLGAAPTGAWWDFADVPSGSGEVWELRAWVSPDRTPGWTFGTWSAVQITNATLVNKQFSASSDGSTGWRDTYRSGDPWQRDRNPSTGQWGPARPLAADDRLRASWGYVVSTEVAWSSHRQGSVVALPAQIDLTGYRDLRVRVDILDSSRDNVRSGYADLPAVVAAPYAQRSSQPRWNDEASFTVASQAAGGTWATVMNGVEGPAPGSGDKGDARLAMKFIQPSGDPGKALAGFLFIYEAKDTGLTHRLTFEGR